MYNYSKRAFVKLHKFMFWKTNNNSYLHVRYIEVYKEDQHQYPTTNTRVAHVIS